MTTYQTMPDPEQPKRKLSTAAIIAIAAGVVVVLVCGVCVVGIIFSRVTGGAGSTAATSPASLPLPPAATASAASSEPVPSGPATPAAVPSPTAPAKVLVPNGVGLDYQSAQDLWRAAGLHVAPAIDATGAHRLPLIDSNWVVLSQDPQAGATVDTGTFITATVKKYSDG